MQLELRRLNKPFLQMFPTFSQSFFQKDHLRKIELVIRYQVTHHPRSPALLTVPEFTITMNGADDYHTFLDERLILELKDQRVPTISRTNGNGVYSLRFIVVVCHGLLRPSRVLFSRSHISLSVPCPGVVSAGCGPTSWPGG